MSKAILRMYLPILSTGWTQLAYGNTIAFDMLQLILMYWALFHKGSRTWPIGPTQKNMLRSYCVCCCMS